MPFTLATWKAGRKQKKPVAKSATLLKQVTAQLRKGDDPVDPDTLFKAQILIEEIKSPTDHWDYLERYFMPVDRKWLEFLNHRENMSIPIQGDPLLDTPQLGLHYSWIWALQDLVNLEQTISILQLEVPELIALASLPPPTSPHGASNLAIAMKNCQRKKAFEFFLKSLMFGRDVSVPSIDITSNYPTIWRNSNVLAICENLKDCPEQLVKNEAAPTKTEDAAYPIKEEKDEKVSMNSDLHCVEGIENLFLEEDALCNSNTREFEGIVTRFVKSAMPSAHSHTPFTSNLLQTITTEALQRRRHLQYSEPSYALHENDGLSIEDEIKYLQDQLVLSMEQTDYFVSRLRDKVSQEVTVEESWRRENRRKSTKDHFEYSKQCMAKVARHQAEDSLEEILGYNEENPNEALCICDDGEAVHAEWITLDTIKAALASRSIHSSVDSKHELFLEDSDLPLVGPFCHYCRRSRATTKDLSICHNKSNRKAHVLDSLVKATITRVKIIPPVINSAASVSGKGASTTFTESKGGDSGTIDTPMEDGEDSATFKKDSAEEGDKCEENCSTHQAAVCDVADNALYDAMEGTLGHCWRTFCSECLSHSFTSPYPLNVGNLSLPEAKKWLCPRCNSCCNCDRCARTQFLKRLATYYKGSYGVDVPQLPLRVKLGRPMQWNVLLSHPYAQNSIVASSALRMQMSVQSDLVVQPELSPESEVVRDARKGSYYESPDFYPSEYFLDPSQVSGNNKRKRGNVAGSKSSKISQAERASKRQVRGSSRGLGYRGIMRLNDGELVNAEGGGTRKAKHAYLWNESLSEGKAVAPKSKKKGDRDALAMFDITPRSGKKGKGQGGQGMSAALFNESFTNNNAMKNSPYYYQGGEVSKGKALAQEIRDLTLKFDVLSVNDVRYSAVRKVLLCVREHLIKPLLAREQQKTRLTESRIAIGNAILASANLKKLLTPDQLDKLNEKSVVMGEARPIDTVKPIDNFLQAFLSYTEKVDDSTKLFDHHLDPGHPGFRAIERFANNAAHRRKGESVEIERALALGYKISPSLQQSDHSSSNRNATSFNRHISGLADDDGGSMRMDNTESRAMAQNQFPVLGPRHLHRPSHITSNRSAETQSRNISFSSLSSAAVAAAQAIASHISRGLLTSNSPTKGTGGKGVVMKQTSNPNDANASVVAGVVTSNPNMGMNMNSMPNRPQPIFLPHGGANFSNMAYRGPNANTMNDIRSMDGKSFLSQLPPVNSGLPIGYNHMPSSLSVGGNAMFAQKFNPMSAGNAMGVNKVRPPSFTSVPPNYSGMGMNNPYAGAPMNSLLQPYYMNTNPMYMNMMNKGGGTMANPFEQNNPFHQTVVPNGMEMGQQSMAFSSVPVIGGSGGGNLAGQGQGMAGSIEHGNPLNEYSTNSATQEKFSGEGY